MPRFFVSYRRDDSLDVTGRIFDRLGNHFGKEAVFMDIDTIPYGVDFRGFLTEWIAQCDAVLVIIGDRWMASKYETGPKQGQRRLDDPSDFVRIEVAAALSRKVPVIPVLVGKTTMPAAEQLPTELTELAFRQAAEVRSGADFHGHMDRLIRGLQKVLRIASEAAPLEKKPEPLASVTLPAPPPPAVVAPAVAAPMNLGFEHGPENGVPAGWFNSFGHVSGVSLNYEIKVVSRRSSDAGLCVQLAGGPDVTADEFGSVMQRCPGQTLAGKLLRLEGELRTEIKDGWAGIWLRLDSPSGRNLFFNNMSEHPVTGSTPWTKYQIKTLVPSSCAWLNYGILLFGQGTVWGDNFKVSV